MSISSINFNQLHNSSTLYNRNSVNFKSNKASSAKIETDSFEHSDKKKSKVSKKKKFLIGLGTTVALICGSALLGIKVLHKKATKGFIWENFKPKTLKQHIDFKSANNLEDAINYTKNTLSIKEVDENIPLSILNFVNEELTTVANAYKGNLVMPSKLEYTTKMQQNAIAGVVQGDCTLQLNKNVFERIKNKLNYQDDLRIKLQENPNSINDLAEQFGVKVEHVTQPSGKRLDFYEGTKTVFYHEMGHLQDWGKNIKILKKDVGYFKFAKNLIKNLFNGAFKRKEEFDIGSLGQNRWGGLTYDGFEMLLKNDPKKFKSKYPDLYEFLTNKEIQNTARKVSNYSTTSIGEFIADTHAQMIEGRTLPDDVIALYKKYNGPLPNSFK